VSPSSNSTSSTTAAALFITYLSATTSAIFSGFY
jgi:hypothetical protein